MEDKASLLVHENATIRAAVAQMDKAGRGFLAVVGDGGSVVGIVTDGDFRRAVLKGTSLDLPIATIANGDYCSLDHEPRGDEVERLFEQKPIRHLPIIDDQGHLVRLIVKDEIGSGSTVPRKAGLLVPVVIMAGGKGTRMRPLSHVLPKPLTPVGDKSIIETIMDRFRRSGADRFYVSLNHKANLVRAYLDEVVVDGSVEYIHETKPLGTAGCLGHLRGRVHGDFFVTNCDILISEDYGRVLTHHRENRLEITIVAAMQHHTIAYGVCEIDSSGLLKTITEKPKLDFLANTGMYVLSSSVLSLIPPDAEVQMTDLIRTAQDHGYHVGVYPVSEGSWIDIGQMAEYTQALDRLQQIT